ncbi:MAG: type II toxin-antitoxin system RelE/ParE family toxin [Gemmatimonadota bacterium]|nr:type II toxin-antitoxin system RelE/ParE family toxin [Gemmatimonadota bacterium]
MRQGLTIEWTTRAIRDMRRIAQQDQERIVAKVEQYAQDPTSLASQVRRLSDSEYSRLCVGSHRVIFAVEHGRATVMTVQRVLHRREAYEQR